MVELSADGWDDIKPNRFGHYPNIPLAAESDRKTARRIGRAMYGLYYGMIVVTIAAVVLLGRAFGIVGGVSGLGLSVLGLVVSLLYARHLKAKFATICPYCRKGHAATPIKVKVVRTRADSFVAVPERATNSRYEAPKLEVDSEGHIDLNQDRTPKLVVESDPTGKTEYRVYGTESRSYLIRCRFCSKQWSTDSTQGVYWKVVSDRKDMSRKEVESQLQQDGVIWS